MLCPDLTHNSLILSKYIKALCLKIELLKTASNELSNGLEKYTTIGMA